MQFNSLTFLVFFAAVVAVNFSLPARRRWILLLLASYVFYAWWSPAFLTLIWISTAVDFWVGRRLAAAPSPAERRHHLLLSLLVNLGLLGLFKYYDFFVGSAEAMARWAGWDPPGLLLHLTLPVGISFYTFQTLSYTIDIYRGERDPEPHLGRFALYVAFFPQLVAGPIERSTRLLPQFAQAHAFEPDRVVRGLRLMLWGYLQKVVIADNLAVVVDRVYAAPGDADGLSLALGTVCFAFQILGDFGGYSLLAIGAAKVLGYELMVNFDRPYFAASIAEFWRRWHISLSTWFRDYLYIPLGGNRGSLLRHARNLMVVFLLSGLWHGASWTFVVWGALHGVALVALVAARRLWPARREIPRALAVPLVFAWVCFAWIFFRAPTLADASTVVCGLPRGWTLDALRPWLAEPALWIAGVGLSLQLLVDLRRGAESFADYLASKPAWLRWSCYYSIGGLIWLGAPLESPTFIYFQF